MKFKLWLEQEEKIYYRIVSDLMYGANARRSGNDIAEGTYWTPRWDAILFMIRSLFLHINSSSLKLNNSNVKIYKTTNPIMKSAPEEHKWAFQYGHDAGEMVLDQLTSKPEIIYDGPINSPEIENLVDQSFKHKPPINYGSKYNLTGIWNGQKVFIHPNYDTKTIEITVPTNSWEFRKVLEIKSNQDWKNFEKDAKIDYNNEDAEIALSYFMHDMNWND